VEAVDVSQLEQHLRHELLEATESLEAAGGQPFAREAARELADATLGGQWGLPAGVPGRAARVIALSATVGSIVDLALTLPDGGLSAAQSATREGHLRRLGRAADHALAESANAAVSVLAGWRPA
jgi:protein-disulfide isomerase-like protein with CxxC motif